VGGSRSGYSAARMPNDLAAGFAITASIPIPPIPTTFFPGASPASALLGSFKAVGAEKGALVEWGARGAM
jgi:hypothetical protein